MLQAVLLDRDGTVIADKHYLADPAGVELLPGAAEGLRMLSGAGVDLFLVTNQSGIGRGYFDEAAYGACHGALQGLLAREGLRFKGARHCPHGPDEACTCRKPATGMWESLSREFDLKSDTCAMIGDKRDDIRFARNAGLKTAILVMTGKGKEAASGLDIAPLQPGEYARRIGGEQPDMPDWICADLAAAARCLLS